MNIVEKLARPDLWNRTGYKTNSASSEPRLRLNCNENPWTPQGARNLCINRYPEKQPAKLVKRLASVFGVAEQNLLITRGADDGIDAILRSFCKPGKDAIVQCSPAFVMYAFFARLQAVKVIDVPLLTSDDFAVDFPNLAAETSAKIFFLCNPNNPTGSTIPFESIAAFAERVSDQALVVVDEAYIEFSRTGSFVAQVESIPNVVVLRTLSKAWSLAGARLGVVIGNSALIEYLKATTSPYPLSRASIDEAMSATEPENMMIAKDRVAKIIEQRRRVNNAIKDMAFVKKVYPSDANFLLIQVDSAESLLEFLSQNGVLIRDQSQQPGLENHVRITVSNREEMDRLLETMSQFEGVAK